MQLECSIRSCCSYPEDWQIQIEHTINRCHTKARPLTIHSFWSQSNEVLGTSVSHRFWFFFFLLFSNSSNLNVLKLHSVVAAWTMLGITSMIRDTPSGVSFKGPIKGAWQRFFLWNAQLFTSMIHHYTRRWSAAATKYTFNELSAFSNKLPCIFEILWIVHVSFAIKIGASSTHDTYFRLPINWIEWVTVYFTHINTQHLAHERA